MVAEAGAGPLGPIVAAGRNIFGTGKDNSGSRTRTRERVSKLPEKMRGAVNRALEAIQRSSRMGSEVGRKLFETERLLRKYEKQAKDETDFPEIPIPDEPPPPWDDEGEWERVYIDPYYGEDDESEREQRIREMERESFDLAPFAVEYYRSNLVDTGRRSPPTRTGRGRGDGEAGAAIAGALAALYEWWKIWTLEGEPGPKGPSTRRKGKPPPTRPVAAPTSTPPETTRTEVATQEKQAAERRRIEQTPREVMGPPYEPPTRPQVGTKAGTTTRAPAPPAPAPPTRVGKILQLDPKLIADLIGEVFKGKEKTGRASNLVNEPGRVDQEQRQAAESGTTTRSSSRSKDCKCPKPKKTKRKKCYEGFYREKTSSISMRKWNEVNCTTGKEIKHG